MRRTLCHTLSTVVGATSLLLCVGVCILWVRSYSRSDAVRVTGSPIVGYAILYSGRGELLMGVSPGPAASFPTGVHYVSETEPERAGEGPPAVFDTFGFGARVEPPPYVVAAHALWVPHGFAALLLSALPARWLLARYRRRNRVRRGLCRACGYDLRGTPQQCPECGVDVAPFAAE